MRLPCGAARRRSPDAPAWKQQLAEAADAMQPGTGAKHRRILHQQQQQQELIKGDGGAFSELFSADEAGYLVTDGDTSTVYYNLEDNGLFSEELEDDDDDDDFSLEDPDEGGAQGAESVQDIFTLDGGWSVDVLGNDDESMPDLDVSHSPKP
jgi:hypothetical protein